MYQHKLEQIASPDLIAVEQEDFFYSPFPSGAVGNILALRSVF